MMKPICSRHACAHTPKKSLALECCVCMCKPQTPHCKNLAILLLYIFSSTLYIPDSYEIFRTFHRR